MAWWVTGYYLAVSALLVYAGYSIQARNGGRWRLAPYAALAGCAIGTWTGLTFWGQIEVSVLALGACFPLGAALRRGSPQPFPERTSRRWGEDVGSGFLYAGAVTVLAITWGPQTRAVLLLAVVALGLIRILLDPVRASRSAASATGTGPAAQIEQSP